MKEYVAVPEALAADPDQVAALFAQSVAYAETLKPKKTTRKLRDGRPARIAAGRFVSSL